MNDSDIQPNPQPKQRYEITLTIEDAPGPFESVAGKMVYEVINSDCVPQDPFTGARPTPGYHPSISLTRVRSNIYKGTIYLDLLRDKDYFWHGICHWQMTDAVVTFQANGVTFGQDIPIDQILSNQATTSYVAKALYFGSTVENLNALSVPMSDYVAANRAKFFSMTMTAKEWQP